MWKLFLCLALYSIALTHSSLRKMNITPEAKVMQSSLHPFHFCVLTYFPFASKLAWGYLGKG